MANQKHVDELEVGVDHWNEWRYLQPRPGFRPELASAYFIGSFLNEVDLRGANLVGAKFKSAHLANAILRAATLREAIFRHTDLSGADLRESTGLVLDDSQVRHTQFGRGRWLDWIPRVGWFNLAIGRSWSLQGEITRRGSVDPWSRLRTVYSGPKFFYHLLFLVAFALPLVFNAVTWKSTNRAQQALSHLQQAVALELAEVNETGDAAREELRAGMATRWATSQLPLDDLAAAQAIAMEALDAAGVSTHAELLARVNARLGGLQPCLQPHCGPARPMWYVMLGFDRGWRTAAIAALLILYNIGRFIVTRAVGDMRDNEERTGWCPALADYGPYYVAHKFMTGLFIVAVLGGAMEIGLFLFTDFVYLPA